MEVKFYRVKDTGIRRAVKVEEDGSRTVIAIIGQVKEMVEREIIFEDNTAGNEDRWLVIRKGAERVIRDYDSLDAAKESLR